MNLPKYVKTYPKFLTRFYPKGFTSIPIKIIFLNQSIYNDLKTASPNPQNIAILKHEEEHMRRLIGKNIVIYVLKYYLFPKFRLEEELAAYEKQFNYLKKYNLKYDLEKVAKNFSGLFYLRATSHENAKRLLVKTWSKA